MPDLLEKIKDDKDYFNYLVEKAVVEYLNKLGVSVEDLRELPNLKKELEEYKNSSVREYELTDSEKKKIKEKNDNSVAVEELVKMYKPDKLEELK